MPGLIADFHHEYEAERLTWLRRRFLIYTAVFGARAVLSIPLMLLTVGRSMPSLAAVATVALTIEAAIFIVPFVRTLRTRRPTSRDALVKTASRVITANLLLQFVASFPVAAALTAYLRAADAIDKEGQIGPMLPLLLVTFFIHFTASVMLPLTPRETIRPVLPFIGVYAAVTVAAPFIFKKDSPHDMILVLPAIAAIALPGLLVAWLRTTSFARSFTNRAVRARYAELSNELSTARRIHDRLFPLPIRDGPVRVDFAYEPMRQIGGDILYARRHSLADPRSPLDLLLIDVTGHGIAAALTVNRLHAELNRLYGLHPDRPPPPGEVIAALNSYVSLTMAAEGFFATAVCIRIDPTTDVLTYANAGHPPVFLAHADGKLEHLDSTTFMLGAADSLGCEFDPGEVSTRFTVGETLVAYSDGAVETHTRSGAMLGIHGLESIVKSKPAASAVVDAVKSLRVGPAQDDMLIVTIERCA